MTTNEISELNLQDDLQEVMETEDASRWKLEHPGPLEIRCTMHSLQEPKELFQVRLVWRSYPNEAPSLKFLDEASGSLGVPGAWPRLPGFRPTSLDACVNYCIEGLRLHPDWQKDPRFVWNPTGNVLLKILRILQQEFDDHYGGRHK
jgi:hypothetical protein